MRSRKDVRGSCFGMDFRNADSISDSAGDLTGIPMSLTRHKWNEAGALWRAGEFYKDLSPEAMSEFESLATPFCCGGSTVIFTEEQEACHILFLLERQAKLTMNSSEGRRLTIGIAGPGELLGLAAFTGNSLYETTAVAQFPCRIAALPRHIFQDFLMRHPVAC